MPQLSFLLKGRIPSKKNSKIMVCRGKFPTLLPSSDYRKWQKDALEQLAKNKIPKKKLQSVPWISVIFYAPDNRKFDLSNKFESIADLLVDYGLLEDDNYSILGDIQLCFGGVEKDEPGALVEMEY